MHNRRLKGVNDLSFCPHCKNEYKEEELNSKRRCAECGGAIPEEKKISKSNSKYSQMSIYSISNGTKTVVEPNDTQQEEIILKTTTVSKFNDIVSPTKKDEKIETIPRQESTQAIEKISFLANEEIKEEITTGSIKTEQAPNDEEMDADLLAFLSQYEIETIEDNELYQLDEPSSNEEKKPFKKNIAVTSKALKSLSPTESFEKKTSPNLNPDDIQKKSNWIHEQLQKNKERKKEKLEPNIEYDFNKDGFYNDSLSKEPAQADIIPRKIILKVIFWALGLVLFTIFIIMYM